MMNWFKQQPDMVHWFQRRPSAYQHKRMDDRDEVASDRRMVAVGLALCLAAGGLLLAFLGAMVGAGFHMLALGELIIVSGLIMIFIGLGAAGVICMIGLIKEWLSLRG